MVLKARRLEAPVEALQWTGNNLDEITAMLRRPAGVPNVIPQANRSLLILTVTGSLRAAPDDWIVRDVDTGALTVCAPALFEQLYQLDPPPPATGEEAP